MGRLSGLAEMAPAADAKIADLQDWVREHRVTWEASSRREAAAGPDAPAPPLVTLSGRYPGGRFPAGNAGLTLVFERLRLVARHVLESVPEARYRIDPFDAAVRLRPESDWVPEVELTLELTTDVEADDVGTPGELLYRIESELERLGARHRHWGDP